jgi:PAS domain S-box-containing protein
MANSPQAEAYLPIRQAEQSLLIATVTGLIAIFFIISYIIKYLIKPLELFTRHIEDLPQKKGDDRFLNINTKDEIGTLSIAFNKMETERERAEEALQINADRVQALLNLNQMTDATLQQITGYALEESVRLSQSKIGYIAFLSEDETVLMMYSWSRQAMEECAIIDKPIHYMVSETGLWGEAVRQRQAVITNNYAAPNQWKKGYPAGHVTVRRHMNVPVFVGQHIVLVAGVGNKDAEYNETDVQQLTLLMDGMWQLIERKRAEEKYRTLFEESKDVVYMSTPDGRFLDMNLAGIELFGYSSKEELLATHITDDLYFKPEDRKDYEMMLFEKGFVKDYEIQMKNKNGKRLSILSTSSIVRDEQGAIKAYRGIMRDITEHKNLEQQLLHSQKMEAIGQLAGGIAHDFNNILTAIIGYGELAQMNVKDNEKIHGYMQQVLDAADRAKDLTKRLLAFSRKQVIETVLADLNDILRNIEKMLRRTIREDIDLRAVLSSGELPVMVDVGQIEQVLINLVANARDAMPEGGHLVIETDTANIDSRYAEAHIFENTGMYAVLTVSDTGIGMDQETRESIFEPFFTTKEVGKGTGLGLSMVYGIIKQHNGSINVYSEIGKGTTFRIYLPLVQTKIETISKPVQIPARGEGETIIIAEDEPQVRESMSLILQKSGYKIIEAENGQDAVKKFKDNRGTVSLVLLDVIMPVKNGLEAYEEIKEIDPSIKTIFMSGYTDVIISRKRLLEEGITFISKPINTATLMEKIRDTLDR